MACVQETYCVAICLLLLYLTLTSASNIQQEEENNKRTIFEEVSPSLEDDENSLNSLIEKFSSASANARDTTLETVLQRLDVAERKIETAERKLDIAERKLETAEDKLVVAEREIKELKTTGLKCEENIAQKNISRRQEYDGNVFVITHCKVTVRLFSFTVKGTAVGFTACISALDLTNLGNHHTIIFDQVITNVGNAYHPYTGIFIAPLKGLYVFHLAAMQAPGHSMYLDIMKNGVRIDNAYVDATGLNIVQSVSEHWVLELDKGQEVWIRTGNAGQIHGYCYTSFSGFLVAQLM